MSVPKNTLPGTVIRCISAANMPNGTLTVNDPDATIQFAPVSETTELIFDGQRWRTHVGNR